MTRYGYCRHCSVIWCWTGTPCLEDAICERCGRFLLRPVVGDALREHREGHPKDLALGLVIDTELSQ
jgi:hypothetical protein